VHPGAKGPGAASAGIGAGVFRVPGRTGALMGVPDLGVLSPVRTPADLAGYSTVVVGVRASTPAPDTSGDAPGQAGPGGASRAAAGAATVAEPLPGAAATAGLLGVDLTAHLSRAGASGLAGEITTVPLLPTAASAVDTLLVVGVGDGGAAGCSTAGSATARALRRATAVAVVLPLPVPRVARFVEAFALASYQVAKAPARADQPARVRLDVNAARPAQLTQAVRRAFVVASAVHLARDLTNTPANVKSPSWLARQAVAAAARSGLAVQVRDDHQLADAGFGGLLGVGQGSARPPRLVELTYRPPGPRAGTHVVLVGKGIVFDSGGISIKPAAGMDSMKTDMAGAAAVMATMTALGSLGVKVSVTGLLAVAENMPGEAALRPSDVITPYGGRRSVEITNTDAEGRLVLADALSYADLVLRPDAIIDVATLTGAAALALGRMDAPLFATDERLASALMRASVDSGERLWRMPLVEDYRGALASHTADLVNGVTDRDVGGGAITAALFLREFTGGRPWAHLDIAGTGRSDSAAGELSRGGTGFGVRLLLRLLQDW